MACFVSKRSGFNGRCRTPASARRPESGTLALLDAPPCADHLGSAGPGQRAWRRPACPSFGRSCVTPTPMPPEAVPFPVFLDLAGAAVLVVGGGEVAVAKCRLLGRSGAVVRAVGPEPCEDLLELAASGAVELHRRRFAPADLDGVRLCYVGLDDEAEAAAVVAEARSRGVPVNAVDRPSLCDFSTPAMVERGPLTIAIGTGGAAPALARDLRARIEEAVPPGFGRLAAFLGRWRGRVAAALADKGRRRAFWDRAVEGPVAEAVLAGDEEMAEALMVRELAGLPARPRGRASLVGARPGGPRVRTPQAPRGLERPPG